MERRTALGILGTKLVGLAGCSLLEDGLEQSAEPAGVDTATVDETEFDHDILEEQTTERTVEAPGESRDATLTNWLNRYTSSVSTVEFDASIVSFFTSPTVTVAGEDINPFDQLDEEELITAMADRLNTGPIENIEPVANRPVTVLEETLTVTEFEAEATYEGATVDIRLHLTTTTHVGDLVVLFALYPELLDYASDVDTLFEGVLHPTDFETVIG